MAEEVFDFIIQKLAMIEEDNYVPKNIRIKIKDSKDILEGDSSVKANKALEVLEDVSNDSNLPFDIRTELMSIMCQLEQTK